MEGAMLPITRAATIETKEANVQTGRIILAINISFQRFQLAPYV
jgi:hypothetical protein